MIAGELKLDRRKGSLITGEMKVYRRVKHRKKRWKGFLMIGRFI